MEINDRQYRCWHEVGHAVICLARGGVVIEICINADDTEKGSARARCSFDPNERRAISCGGFAAEYYLYLTERLNISDHKEFTQTIFRNATHDREIFVERELGPDDQITLEEDELFMNCAKTLMPFIKKCAPGIDEIVSLLETTDRIDGTRIEEILRRYLET